MLTMRKTPKDYKAECSHPLKEGIQKVVGFRQYFHSFNR